MIVFMYSFLLEKGAGVAKIQLRLLSLLHKFEKEKVCTAQNLGNLFILYIWKSCY